MADALAAFIDAARSRVEHALDRYLPRPPRCPPLVYDAMRYSLFAGGKRLRPILTLASAEAVDRSAAELALPSACAVELIHTYSLIHDDLPAMDDDTLRRGRPTLHVIYGDGLAILAGDALQAEAFALAAREPAADAPAIAARKLRALTVLAEAAGAMGMVGGQAIDLEAAGQVRGRRVALDGEALQAMHLRKTGALIRAASATGAIMAGGSTAAVAAVDQWAAEIGLAFQIVDDILDVEGSAEDLGKTTGKDAAGAKPTYPALFGIERSRQMARDCAERAQDILIAAKLTRSLLPSITSWVVARHN